MNIALIDRKTKVCQNVAVFNSLEDAKDMFENNDILEVAEIKDGFGIGDIYKNGVWSNAEPTDKPKTPQQQREAAYETLLYKEDGAPLILWEGEAITVDMANKKWLDYSAEGENGIEYANNLTALISNAKTYIRNLYTDNPSD